MRVLHYVWSTHFGGIERLALDLVGEQRSKCGHHVGILVGQDKGEFSSSFHAGCDEFLSLDLINGRDRNSGKRKAAVEFMRQFDIVHIHTFNPTICRAAIESGRKIIYTEHGNFGFGRKRTWADLFKSLLLRRFLNQKVDYVTFNSNFTMQFARSRYDLKSVEKSVVYNGICIPEQTKKPTADIAPEILAATDGKFVVGTTSRFAGFKRVDRLVDAFAKFSKGRNDVVLLLVGDGVLRQELERHVERVGIRNQVIFAGFRSNVGDYQSLIDVCVFPSECEPFGLVAVETLARGKPTLVFRDGGGIIEIVAPVCPGDVVESIDMMADRLTNYYESRDLLADTDNQRRNRADVFKISTMASEMDVVYLKVVNQSSTGTQRPISTT